MEASKGREVRERGEGKRERVRDGGKEGRGEGERMKGEMKKGT